MTRINTNVSSINAQKTLARSNASLQESLTRLSTGLRINSGKDDPAGLIASEVLRSDIISVEKAITNSERANQMIATADSALGQVSSLLNDIRGLVSEAANTGAMSAEQIAANQLQIDSSLEAIDRIAQTTKFQGRTLLDGSLDFLTEGVNPNQLQDIQIDQANFGSLSQIDVSVDVVTQATKASLNYGQAAISADTVLEVGGKNGFEAFSFAAGSSIEDMAASINLVSDALGVTATVQTEATAGSITVSSFGTNNDIVLTAKTAGFDAGNMLVKYTASPAGTSSISVDYTAASGSDPGTINVNLATSSWDTATYTFFTDDTVAHNALKMTAKDVGEDYNGWTVIFSEENAGGVAGAQDRVVWNDSGKTITLVRDSGAAPAAATADHFKAVAAADKRFAAMFTLEDTNDSDGSGTIVGGGAADVTVAAADSQKTEVGGKLGVNGGAILSTANDVITAINNKALLKDHAVASLAAGNNGYGIVTAFEESAYYGSATANNALQFLGLEDSANIRFVATAGASLGIDTSTDPKVEGFASAVINMGARNADPNLEKSTLQITARAKGAAYDDVTINFVDTNAGTKSEGFAVWDEKDKILTIHMDHGVDDMDDVVNYVNNTDAVKDVFRANLYGTSNGAVVVPASPTAGHTAGTTSGGLVSAGTVIVNLATNASGVVTTTAQSLIDYFDATGSLSSLGISVSNVQGSDGSGLLAATTSDIAFAATGKTTTDTNASATVNTSGGIDSMFTITADIAGAAYEGVTVEFEGTAVVAATPTVAYDAATKKLTIGIVDGATTALNVINAINNDATVKELFTAAVKLDIYGDAAADSDGSGVVYITDNATLTGGTTTTGTGTGTALLGNADEANTGLTFTATEYGSDAFISVKTLNGVAFELTDSAGDSAERVTGTDVDARINGVQALGKGLTATINTSALDVSFSVNSSMTDNSTASFSIVGGGATFQLGPDVVSNQQARLGISSVNTTKLGGTAGRLYELRSGNSASLANDTIAAAAIVEETITEVVNLRGRLGAFQSTTLDTNIASLEDTLENLTAAESDIRDADFAQESAALTRAQILVQSGISVLAMANQNPQSVLQLLQ